MTKVYFIIVTYNAMKWAERCFNSLRHSNLPVQCIVIDNCSTDGTQEYIKAAFPEVDFIQSAENLGFGKANNIGIEKAYNEGADFIYLMNQDAWIFPDSIEKLLEVYKSHPNIDQIGILSPIHIDGTEKKLDIFLEKYIAANFKTTRLISDLYFQTLKSYYKISFINAAHWLIPKKTIEIVGGFNPIFFHYGEDNEYVNRLHFHKKEILLVPESIAVHDGKQFLNKVDYSKYKKLDLETKILNPNLSNTLEQEKKAIIKRTIITFFKGNLKDVKQNLKTYYSLVENSRDLIEMRNKITNTRHPFLNLAKRIKDH